MTTSANDIVGFWEEDLLNCLALSQFWNAHKYFLVWWEDPDDGFVKASEIVSLVILMDHGVYCRSC